MHTTRSVEEEEEEEELEFESVLCCYARCSAAASDENQVRQKTCAPKTTLTLHVISW
jgi:hypothetical protein